MSKNSFEYLVPFHLFLSGMWIFVVDNLKCSQLHSRTLSENPQNSSTSKFSTNRVHSWRFLSFIFFYPLSLYWLFYWMLIWLCFFSFRICWVTSIFSFDSVWFCFLSSWRRFQSFFQQIEVNYQSNKSHVILTLIFFSLIDIVIEFLCREKENPIQTIVDTIDDYLKTDIKGHLLEGSYRIFVISLFTLRINYLFIFMWNFFVSHNEHSLFSVDCVLFFVIFSLLNV